MLTNQPGIDISAALPEFSSDELQSQQTPTLPRSLDLDAWSGLGRRSQKILICGKSHERQSMAVLHGSSDDNEKIWADVIGPDQVNAEVNKTSANDEVCLYTE